MSLIDLQRGVVELCCGTEPNPAQLAALGDERIWRLYRELIRGRLLSELKTALRRTHAAAGKAVFERAFVHHLQSDPPRTRFFHALVAGFAQSAASFFRADATLPAHLGDLVEYEAALWAVSDLPDPGGAPASEFAFDKAVVLSPALRLLALSHAVHRAEPAGAAYARAEVYLCVHRRPDEKKAKTWELNAVSHALMQRLESGALPSDAVQQVAAARAIAVDAQFVDGLCSVLADFIERGIILGAR